jgi:hypothetical protein
MEPFEDSPSCFSPDSTSSTINHSPTEAFQLSYIQYAEVEDAVKTCSTNNDHLQEHILCQSKPFEFTPGSQIALKYQVFNDLDVCWEYEWDSPLQESPCKRKPSKYRFSSLDSALQSLDLRSCESARHVSGDINGPLQARLEAARARVFSVKQENVPYNIQNPFLAYLDGTWDDNDETYTIPLFKTSPSCSNVVTRTSSMEAATSNVCPEFPDPGLMLPPCTLSANTIQEGRKCLDGSYDLTLPSHSALLDPFDCYSDASTPLTCASPANGAFPFLTQERSPNSLTPFTIRSGASPIRTSQRLSNSRKRSRSLTPSQRQDRFIPTRKNSQTFKESLQVTKSPEKLTASERVLRSNNNGPDPFSSNIPRTPPRMNLRHTGFIPVTASRSPNNILDVRRVSITPGARQVSNGAVWNVGGTVALGDSVAGISDGHRGLLASGTNAPLYSANFLARVSTSTQLEVHERRLALALDLDTSSRVLKFQNSSPSSTASPASSNSAGTADGEGSRVWKDSRWIQEGSVTRLSLMRNALTQHSPMYRNKTRQEAQESCACDSIQISLRKKHTLRQLTSFYSSGCAIIAR